MFLNSPVGPSLSKSFLLKGNKQAIILAPGKPQFEIVKLPQSNMPCYKPDVSIIAAMPTLKAVLPYQFIPNPYYKYNSLPTGGVNNTNSLLK